MKLSRPQISRLGGLAGRGKAKARPSWQARAAVNKRWLAWRASRGENATIKPVGKFIVDLSNPVGIQQKRKEILAAIAALDAAIEIAETVGKIET